MWPMGWSASAGKYIASAHQLVPTSPTRMDPVLIPSMSCFRVAATKAVRRRRGSVSTCVVTTRLARSPPRPSGRRTSSPGARSRHRWPGRRPVAHRHARPERRRARRRAQSAMREVVREPRTRSRLQRARRQSGRGGAAAVEPWISQMVCRSGRGRSRGTPGAARPRCSSRMDRSEQPVRRSGDPSAR